MWTRLSRSSMIILFYGLGIHFKMRKGLGVRSLPKIRCRSTPIEFALNLIRTENFSQLVCDSSKKANSIGFPLGLF